MNWKDIRSTDPGKDELDDEYTLDPKSILYREMGEAIESLRNIEGMIRDQQEKDGQFDYVNDAKLGRLNNDLYEIAQNIDDLVYPD